MRDNSAKRMKRRKNRDKEREREEGTQILPGNPKSSNVDHNSEGRKKEEE